MKKVIGIVLTICLPIQLFHESISPPGRDTLKKNVYHIKRERDYDGR